MLFPINFIALLYIIILTLVMKVSAFSATMENHFPKLIAFDLGDYDATNKMLNFIIVNSICSNEQTALSGLRTCTSCGEVVLHSD